MGGFTERILNNMDGIQVEKSLHRQGQASRRFDKKAKRHYKSVGLGIPTPQSAKTGKYIDKKCPWTGMSVSIRGKVMKGIVISTKMTRTCVVRRNYLHYLPKYKRYEKRHSRSVVHVSPALNVNEGDILTFGECRPLSKTVRFNALKVEANRCFVAPKKVFKLF